MILFFENLQETDISFGVFPLCLKVIGNDSYHFYFQLMTFTILPSCRALPKQLQLVANQSGNEY